MSQMSVDQGVQVVGLLQDIVDELDAIRARVDREDVQRLHEQLFAPGDYGSAQLPRTSPSDQVQECGYTPRRATNSTLVGSRKGGTTNVSQNRVQSVEGWTSVSEMTVSIPANLIAELRSAVSADVYDDQATFVAADQIIQWVDDHTQEGERS